MWTCPNCGRTFKRTNQGHYCGEAPKTVAAYIESQPPDVRHFLNKLVDAIRTSVPDATERIAWSMPFFEKGGRSLSFAACKHHVSLYAGAEAIDAFASELHDYTTNKNAIYLPYTKDVPLALIAAITRWCLP